MSNRNARAEFEKHIENRLVACASLCLGDPSFSYRADDVKRVYLYPGYTPEDYADFLRRIDGNYDAGYGGQNLFGTIWYTDGTWSDRAKYDGAEWWEYRSCPAYPDEFNHATITGTVEVPQLPK